ncbi:hypothetical protein [Lactococcus lactis]|uniref:hypothetical protein n=1 Tax=Lactococcus lactis TaxID=1358 RepID=UPI00223B91AC|nr:hypothetical protein [Lactococcus lactis]MCT0068044.1 hypothetical protein [Lactococcus lactis subsp. lactis]
MDNKRISEIVEEEMIKQDANRYRDMRKILKIPKSIADLLDEIPNEAKEYVRVNDFGEYTVLDDFVELREFYEADEDEIFPKFMELKEFVKDNLNLCVAYLTGKALGVDLVKVVADE